MASNQNTGETHGYLHADGVARPYPEYKSVAPGNPDAPFFRVSEPVVPHVTQATLDKAYADWLKEYTRWKADYAAWEAKHGKR